MGAFFFMPMTKAPSFQFYPTDIAPDLDPLTMLERGAYLTMMRQLWPHGGPMPIDEADAILQKPWVSMSDVFRRRFAEKDGKICLAWMEEQREKQALFRQLQAVKGRKGGRPSKAKKPSLSSGLTESKPKQSPRVGVGVGNGVGVNSGEKERASEVEIIPEGFTVEHWRAIQRWFTYREQSKKKLNPMSKDGFIKKWQAKGEAATIAAIDNSIEKGYQGCFEPDATQRPNGKLTEDQERAARFAHIATLYPNSGH